MDNKSGHNYRLTQMSANMSDIIEFITPKDEFVGNDGEDDSGGGIGIGDAMGSISNNNSNIQCSFVVLDAVGNVVSTAGDQLNEYINEEFLIINEDNNEGELLVDDAELEQQLSGYAGYSMLRVPKTELFDGDEDYAVTEQHLDDIEDLVMEEGLDEEEDEVEYKYNRSPTPPPTEPLELELELPSPKPLPLPKPAIKFQSNPQESIVRSKRTNNTQYIVNDDDNENDNEDDGEDIGQDQVDEDADKQDEAREVAIKPSDKAMNEFKGPRRYLLFDELIATIVDFDEDNTPIVEFSMVSSTLDEKLPVECGICPDVMHKSKLSKHQKTHIVPGTNRYACIYCTETYRDCKYLAGHARRHMGIRPYVCELCKLYFSTKQDLRVHNQRRHLEKEHICEMCGKTFAQNTQLKRHREATHEKKRRFQCQYCQKAYYKNFSLQEHIRNVHMGKRRMLSCPFCGMQCRDAHKMARHRKEMHLNQDSYVCYLCQEEFTDINYFDAHKRSIQCRSNTRRHVDQDQQSNPIDVPNSLDDEGTIDGVKLWEEYDEDAGLLIEGEGERDGEVGIHAENTGGGAGGGGGGDEEDNTNYLHEQQFIEVAPFEQTNFDDRLLVERVADEGEGVDEVALAGDEDDEVIDEEQYMAAMQQQYQQQQQQQQMSQQDFNDDELIYEITLETDDN